MEIFTIILLLTLITIVLSTSTFDRCAESGTAGQPSPCNAKQYENYLQEL